MHELSIANAVLNYVLKEKKSRKIDQIKAIGLKIGALSDILPEALEFSFDVIKKETPLEKTRLEITKIDIKGVCQNCRHEFDITDLIFTCPNCNSSSVEVCQGQELDIAYLDIEDEKELICE